jgi:hypothetical protein
MAPRTRARRALVACLMSALVAIYVTVCPPVAADSPNGNDSASAGAGTQDAEWHASARSVSLTSHPFDS